MNPNDYLRVIPPHLLPGLFWAGRQVSQSRPAPGWVHGVRKIAEEAWPKPRHYLPGDFDGGGYPVLERPEGAWLRRIETYDGQEDERNSLLQLLRHGW